jgi:hypothetical protein
MHIDVIERSLKLIEEQHLWNPWMIELLSWWNLFIASEVLFFFYVRENYWNTPNKLSVTFSRLQKGENDKLTPTQFYLSLEASAENQPINTGSNQIRDLEP